MRENFDWHVLIFVENFPAAVVVSDFCGDFFFHGIKTERFRDVGNRDNRNFCIRCTHGVILITGFLFSEAGIGRGGLGGRVGRRLSGDGAGGTGEEGGEIVISPGEIPAVSAEESAEGGEDAPPGNMRYEI